MITIRKIKTIKEYHDCETLQQKVWQFTEREIIPLNELLTIQKNGGLVLGAFSRSRPAPATAGRERDGDKPCKLIGFIFGFPGLSHGRLIHCSRMLAVLPTYRNTSIGARLKFAQRQFALKQGINLITWTFDPLQSLNAYFNIVKLGVIIRKYETNLYGPSSSILNQGMATDRFLAEWRIKDKFFGHPRKKYTNPARARDESRIVNPTYYNKNGLLVCSRPKLDIKFSSRAKRGENFILVEIPFNIMSLKKSDAALAGDWRKKTRQIFISYFNKSYIITNFIVRDTNKQRRSFYVLRKI
ncbi:MAG: hypothetical protein AAB019_02760 [Planctomycetota bacterium]